MAHRLEHLYYSHYPPGWGWLASPSSPDAHNNTNRVRSRKVFNLPSSFCCWVVGIIKASVCEQEMPSIPRNFNFERLKIQWRCCGSPRNFPDLEFLGLPIVDGSSVPFSPLASCSTVVASS